MDTIVGFGKTAEFIKHPLVLVGFALILVFSIHKLIINSGIMPKLDKQQGASVVTSLLRYGFWLGVLIMLLGFGLQFYQTYANLRYAANTEQIVENLTKNLQDKEDTIKALTKAINDLPQAGNEAQVNEAFAALAREDTSKAKVLFAKAAQKGEQNVKQTAQNYRNFAALASLDNTQEALQAYRRATQLDPDNTEGWNQLGILSERAGELVESIDAYNKVLALGETHHDPQETAAAYGNLGNVYRIRGDLDKAIEFEQKALAINESLGRKEGMAIVYGNLGNVYRIRGDLDKAIEFYQKALVIFSSLDIKNGMANTYGNLGNIYQMRGDLDKAIEFQEKTLAINESLGNKIDQEINANAYGNLGNVYQMRGDMDKAIESQQKALAINESLGRKEGMAIAYGNLGNIYLMRGDLDNAIKFQQKSLAIDESLGRKEGMANAYGNLGSIYQLQGNKTEAKRYYRLSIELFKQLGSPNAQTAQAALDALQ